MKSFLCAFRGLAVLFSTQRNARIHLIFFVLTGACGIIFGISLVEWSLIFLASGVVMAAEAFNTALELLADVVHPAQHSMVGWAKDVAAGAVLITAIAAVGIGLIIFIPKLADLPWL